MHNFIIALKREFTGYNLSSFKQDCAAGVTVAAVSLPLALAFGAASGGGAGSGIIAAVIGGLVVGLLSCNSFQIAGPTGSMTAILLLLFNEHGAAAAFCAGALAGVFLLIGGLIRIGKIISIIPSPVVAGFTSGIALIILIGQLDNFFGTTTPAAGSTAGKLLNFVTAGHTINGWAVALSLFAMAVIILYPKKLIAVFPPSLAAILLTWAVCSIFKMPVNTIGEIPHTLLPNSRLMLSDITWANINLVAVPALSIAVLGMMEALLCGEVGGRLKEEKLHPNHELLVQGIANIIVPFFGGIPITSAMSRSSVGIRAGGKTRVVSIVHSLVLLACMLFFAPSISKIPLAALAGVLVMAAWRMNDWASIRYIFSTKFAGAIAKFVITISATLVLDLAQAVVIGIACASMMVVYQISVDMEISIVKIDEKLLTDNHGLKASKAINSMRVVFFSGAIFFANIQYLNKQIEQLDGVKLLIFSMRGVPLIDTSGVVALNTLQQKLADSGIKIMLSGLQKPVQKRLERSGFIDKIGTQNVFWSADKAIAKALVVASE